MLSTSDTMCVESRTTLSLREARDEVAEAHALLGVEARRGLVEHEHRRVVEHRLRDAEPLLQPPENVRIAAAFLAGEPHGGKQLEGALARGAPPDALERGHVLHEVEGRELRVVAEILRKVPEQRPVLAAMRSMGAPSKRTSPEVGRSTPHAMRMSVVLPAPFAAEQAVHARAERPRSRGRRRSWRRTP